jgi:putative phage-type endonuclease
VTVVPLKRPVTIGGSDIAAACGIDPHRSRIALWLEKTGRIERVETEAMRWGRRLQAAIEDELLSRGYPISGVDGETYTDPERPWLVGHLDGFTIVEGETAVLEVKTAGQWGHKSWGDQPPVEYVAQVQAYLHLTELNVGLIAVLVGGQRLEVRTVRREPRAIPQLLALAEDFYGYVLRDEPPAPDGSDSAREAVAALYPEAVPTRVTRLSKTEYELLGELRALREQEKAVERQRVERENLLKLAMGDAEEALSPHDEAVIRWRNVQATRLDLEQLKAEMPAVYDQYAVTSEARRFTLL